MSISILASKPISFGCVHTNATNVLLCSLLLSCFCFVCLEEAIDGDMFLTISADILRACGFKAGEIVTIIKYSNMPFEAVSTVRLESYLAV